MKKTVFVLFLVLACLLLLVACNDKADSPFAVEITTARSGTIETVVYDKADVSKGTASLTPTVVVASKGITDDGRGLFTVRITGTGGGTTAVSKDKAKVGETITVTATPDKNWRLDGVAVNGELLPDGVFTFTMPERNVEVTALYVYLIHHIDGNEHISFDNGSRDIVEGEKTYFTVEFHEENSYYDDSDVRCLCNDENVGIRFEENVDRGSYTAKKYSFVAPAGDCHVYLTTHPWRSLTSVEVFTPDHTYITEQCSIEVYCGDALYNTGSKVKDGSTFRIKLTFDEFPYRVTDLYSMTSSHFFVFTADATDPGTLTFLLDHKTQGSIPNDVELGIRIEEDTTMHAVTLQKEGSGTVSFGGEYAKEGSTVTIEAAPENGYVLASLKITTDGENYTRLAEKNGKCSFVMPTSDVTVLARFLTENKKHGVYVNADYESQIRLLTLGKVSDEYSVWGEEFYGETVFFHVEAEEDYFILPTAQYDVVTISSLGNGDYCFVMPDTDVMINVGTRQTFEWSIQSFKYQFGEYLQTWTITGSISGTHTDEATFKVVEGESLEIYFTAKSGEELFRLSIESKFGSENQIEYIGDAYIGGRISYRTWIDEVWADSYDIAITVSVRG